MTKRTLVATRRSVVIAAGFVAVLWIIEGLDAIVPGQFESNGVRPRSEAGLTGIVFGPLLHDDWAHLIGNSAPLLVLGFLLALAGVRTFATVTVLVWLTSGLGTWLIGGASTLHVGASGIVFGWIAYLVLRGVFADNVRQIFVGVVVFFAYGGALIGVLPGQPGISWEGHLFGAIGGVVAAWWLRGGVEDSQN
ncbi:MAG: rhomboid family intramembrane serine protease [Aeromicrobium sp.]|uniref:rhomboid family intramembrane serine protease n=1 Tax=Aeromicrobium sp. TaxID=1871063 RepID=UPI003C67ED9C